jgi:uncharacterized membrane protein
MQMLIMFLTLDVFNFLTLLHRLAQTCIIYGRLKVKKIIFRVLAESTIDLTLLHRLAQTCIIYGRLKVKKIIFRVLAESTIDDFIFWLLWRKLALFYLSYGPINL